MTLVTATLLALAAWTRSRSCRASLESDSVIAPVTAGTQGGDGTSGVEPQERRGLGDRVRLLR